MKRTQHLEAFILRNFILMSLFAAMLFVAPLAKAANENNNVPVTTVAVEDIKAEIDMPKILRSGRPASQLNNLVIDGFGANTSENGFLNLAFTAAGKGNMYVRIVDMEGFDVFFETVKGDVQTYNKQLATADLKPGVYFFQVTRGNKTYNKKLILN
jgi:hypothetical protein